MKTRRIILTFVAVVLALSCFFALSSCGKEEKPADILSDAIEKTIEDRTPEFAEALAQKLSALSENCADGGSFELSVGGLSDIESFEIPLSNVALKGYISNNKIAYKLSATDTSSKSGEVYAFVSGESIVLSTPALDNAYGISVEELVELIKAEAGDAAGMFESILGSTSTDAALQQDEELLKMLESYLEYIDELVEKYAVGTKLDESGEIVLTFTVNNDNAKLFIKDLLTKIKNDTELKAFVEEYIVMLGEIESNADFEWLTDDDINEAVSSLDDADFELVVTAKMTTKKIIKELELSATAEGETASIKLDLNDKLDVALVVSVDGESVTLKYDAEEEGDVYSATFGVSMDGFTLYPISFEYNKKSGDYKASLIVPGSVNASVEGNFSVSKDEAVFGISKIKYSDLAEVSIDSTQFELELDIKYTIKAKDTMPTAPTEYTDIAELNEQAAMGILEELSEDPFFANLLSMFMSGSEG